MHAVSSSDVNAYLRTVSGREISAKDFRTWAGTVKAAMAFASLKGRPARRRVRDVVGEVAEALGNTVAVCRKCYIHPAVIAGYDAGTLALRVPRSGRDGLSAAECAVLAWLKRAARK